MSCRSGPVGLDRLDLAGMAARRLPREADARRRRRRRHLEPDDLPEVARRGRLVRRAAQGGARGGGRAEGDLLPARGRRHPGRLRRAAPVWDEGRGKDGYVSMEVDPTLAYDQEATIAEALRAIEDRQAEPLRQDPGDRARPRAIEECIARGRSINVTLIFGLERYAAVAESYIRGLERLVEAGGDPAPVASSWSVLRLPVDTEADKRLDAVGAPELKGKLASRTRSSPTSATGSLPPARWEALAAKARRRSAVSGPRPRRRTRTIRTRLRRRADRAGDGEHDAAGDDRRLSRITGRSPRRSRPASTRPGAFAALAAPVSTTTTSPTRSSGEACRSSATRSRSCSKGSRRNAASSLRRDRPVRRRADLGVRRVALDRLGRGPLARLARRRHAGAAHVDELNAFSRPRPSSSTTASCSAWAAPRSRPRC